MNTDGYIVIGTELDTNDLEKQLKKSLSDLEKYEKNAKKLLEQKAKIELDTSQSEAKLDYLEEKINDTQAKLKTARASVESAATYKEAEKRSAMVSQLESQEANLTNQSTILGLKYEEQLRTQEKINQEIQSNANIQEQLKSKIDSLNSKLKSTSKTMSLDGIKKSVDNIGDSVKNVTKKVVRWGLAIFGIRSAYLFIRRAASELASRDDKLAADLEYIRFALASILEPLIKRIVQWVYQLLSYVGYLAKAWFGINIFANATMKKFMKTNKEAKKLQKTLTSFDEMNILNDNRDKDDKKTLPSFDLSKNKGDIPEWLKWLGDHGKELLAILAGIAGALLAIYLGAGLIKALGIGIAIAGIVWAIEGLLEYLKEPTWENFGQIIQGLGIFVIGLGIAFFGLPGIIAGVAILIYGTIVKYWDKIRDFLQGGIDWLTEKSDWVHEHLGDIIGNIYDMAIGDLQKILNFLDNTMKRIKGNFDELIKFIKFVFAGDWKSAWQSVKDIFKNIFDEVINIFEFAMNLLWKLLDPLGIISNLLSSFFPSTTPKKKSTKSNNTNTRRAKGGIFYPSMLPKLALGGIINQPGRGIPYNGAIIGERGAEAVVPLTDSQQMALLGEAIGRYITVNANITNTMNGRVISRELQKVQNDNNFASNR